MTKEARCKNIRNSLFSAITKVASVPDNCVRKPGIDFTRNRKLPLSAMLLHHYIADGLEFLLLLQRNPVR